MAVSTKSKKLRFRSALGTTFKQFCEISSIHGVKYFHDKEINWVGKCIWVAILLAMFFCANAMVFIFYEDFASNPIRMNIESDHVPLTNLVFPAVTICPPSMFNYPDMKKMMRNITLPANLTIDEAVSYLSQIYTLTGKTPNYDEQKLNALQTMIGLNNMTALEFYKVIRWNCTDLFYRCRFQSKIVNCSSVFAPTMTFTGYCCSFNIKKGLSFLRYRALQFGPEGGLSVIIKNTRENQVNLEQFISAEYELIVHQNDHFPHRTTTSNSIPMKREIFAVIRPTEILCSEEFKALAVKDRQCLMAKEHNMRYFKVYSSDNCEFECRVLSTFDACGCVPYFYASGSERRGCDFDKVPCIFKTYSYFESTNINTNRTIATNSSCYCPNSCESIEYDVQTTHAQLQTVIESFDPFYHGIQENYTVLHVFMSSQVYRRLRRDTLSDIIILIGNLGSSFSLFVGMSLISLVEIMYFFILVLYRNYKSER